MKYLVFDAEEYPRWFDTEEEAIAFATSLSIATLAKDFADPVTVLRTENVAVITSSVETKVKRLD